MGLIDYARFERVLSRSAEIAAEPGMKQTVVRVYNDIFGPAAESFLAAHAAVTKAESAFAKENEEAADALDALDKPYREARSVVRAFVPTVKLPETLKAKWTDTDKLNAIEALLDAIDDHAGEAWADELLAGEFGQKAPVTVKELNEAIAANKSLSEARDTRAQAYGPAYERYLRFKRVVRDALGATSKQYKRIHVRGPNAADDEEQPAPQPAPTPPPTP
jgi:hypothetical protein